MKLLSSFIRLAFYVIAISVLSFIQVQAHEADIGENIGRIAVNPVTYDLAFPVRGIVTGEIVVTNNSLIEQFRLNVLASPYSCVYSRDGSKLYVSIWVPAAEGYEFEYDEDAKLAVIDTATWAISYYDLPAYPIEMYVPESNDKLYLICGAYDRPGRAKRLVKIDTSNGNILVDMECGIPKGGGMVMNREETKIYIDSGEKVYDVRFTDLGMRRTGRRYSKLWVYDAQTQELLDEVTVGASISHIIQGPDDMLILAYNSSKTPGNPKIALFCTLEDEIIHEFKFADNIFWKLSYDESRDILYASNMILVDVTAEIHGLTLERRIWRPSDYIIAINLTDYSHTTVHFAPEPIAPIALSPDGTRLYAGAADGESPMIYYVDLE